MIETEAFEIIAHRIRAIQNVKSKPIRVAINGIEGTGKTVFAEKLSNYLTDKGFIAKQVTIDGFHFNKERRYRQGRDSGKGYYEDCYNEMSFVEKVLKASQAENPHITAATHDLESDEYLDLEPIEIDPQTVLITDGAYLFKAIYRDHWDLKVYLKTSFETAMSRGINRDMASLGGFDQTKEKFIKRYHEASRIYIAENEPEKQADIVFDNSDFEDLRLVRNSY